MLEVALRQGVEVVVRRVLARHRDGEARRGVGLLHDVDDRLHVVVAADENRDHEGVLVARDERGILGRVVNPRVQDLARRLPLARELVDERFELRRVDRVAVGPNDHNLARLALELLLRRRECLGDEVVGLLRLRGARDRRLGREALEDRPEENEGQDDRHTPCNERPLRVSGTTYCEPTGQAHSSTIAAGPPRAKTESVRSSRYRAADGRS